MSIIEGLFRSHSFETGMHHPAEDILTAAWKYDREGIVPEVARILAKHKGGFAADLLRCLGRVQAAAADGLKWVEDALKEPSYDWRDAAFYALEHWDTPEGWRILQAHTEPDPYLDDYKRRLLEERGMP